MKITIFTGNSNRHKFLIKILKNYDLYIVQEEKKFSYLKSNRYQKNLIEKSYFKKVKKAEQLLFGKITLSKNMYKEKIKLKYKEVNNLKFNSMKKFLKSDLYIVFGSSIIKGTLLDFLIKKKCINIHMGISPFYRGTNCNFWATYDKNFDLVGSTIHYLTKEIDKGPILYHSISDKIRNPINYSMAAVKAAIFSIANFIDSKEIFNFKPVKQNISKQIRYCENKDFNYKLIKKYPKKIDIKKNKNIKLIRPYILKKENIYDKNFKI